MKVKIKKLHPDVVIPTYAHPGDAGLDLYSLEDYKIQPGEKKRFDLGFALEFPTGYVAKVFDRGSMAKAGLHTVGGVFDCTYRGEYNCTLVNLSQNPYEVKKGERVGQLIIFPIAYAEFEQTDELSESSRGNNRWGSTGK